MANNFKPEKWAQITIERWQKRIDRLDVRETRELRNSFLAHLELASGGDVNKIVFTYLYYGLFPQIGVGKGVKMGQPSNRIKKQWYAGVLKKEIRILAAQVAERYGDEAVNAIRRIELMNRNNGN